MGPVGIAFSALINAFRSAEITLINNLSLFLYHVIGFPKLAFKTASVIFLAVAVLRSKIHYSFPVSVVFVKASLVSFGAQIKLLIKAFAGNPFTIVSA